MINVQNIYPEKTKRSHFLAFLRACLKWVAFVAIFACPLINYLVGGKPWSVVVVWGIIVLYDTFLSPDVIDITILNQVMRWSIYCLVMLVLIGVFLAPGWIYFILPIVGFSSLVIVSAVFFIDCNKQKKQAMPFFFMIVLALASFVTVCILGYPLNWPLIVLGSLAGMLLLIYIIAFGKEFLRELKKRFHLV